MLINPDDLDHVYLATGYTDLRRGIDGLAGIIKNTFDLDPYQKSMFLFCGRRTDRIKALLWCGDGFLLLYKRFETGRLQWPRNESELEDLSIQQYRWLLEGLSIYQKNTIPKIYPCELTF